MYNKELEALLGKEVHLNSPFAELRLIQNGLPTEVITVGAKLLGVSESEYALLIGFPINYRKVKDKLSPQASERAVKLASLAIEVNAYFLNQAATINWLRKPSILFSNKPPLEICDSILGIEMVLNEVNQLKHGFTA